VYLHNPRAPNTEATWPRDSRTIRSHRHTVARIGVGAIRGAEIQGVVLDLGVKGMRARRESERQRCLGTRWASNRTCERSVVGAENNTVQGDLARRRIERTIITQVTVTCTLLVLKVPPQGERDGSGGFASGPLREREPRP
jgi:hypothetical protein